LHTVIIIIIIIIIIIVLCFTDTTNKLRQALKDAGYRKATVVGRITKGNVIKVV